MASIIHTVRIQLYSNVIILIIVNLIFQVTEKQTGWLKPQMRFYCRNLMKGESKAPA